MTYISLIVGATDSEWNKLNLLKINKKEFSPGCWIYTDNKSYARISFNPSFWRYHLKENRLWMTPLRQFIEDYFELTDALKIYRSNIDIFFSSNALTENNKFDINNKIFRSPSKVLYLSDDYYKSFSDFCAYVSYVISCPVRDKKSGLNILFHKDFFKNYLIDKYDPLR